MFHLDILHFLYVEKVQKILSNAVVDSNNNSNNFINNETSNNNGNSNKNNTITIIKIIIKQRNPKPKDRNNKYY